MARVADMVTAQRGVDLVVLPELWAHGAFTPRLWAERAEPLDGELVRRLSSAARRAGVYLHGAASSRRPRPGPIVANRAVGCGTPRWCSARTVECWPATVRFTGSVSVRGSR
ncbi:nitrilase-related carbon-nitrogen hydrolase [Mycobacterium sp. NPDC003449]